MREREKQITFWTTYDEYKEIKNKSEKVGLSISEYLRTRAIGFEPKEKPPREFYDAIREIRKVGVNINQIARLANATGSIDELYCKKNFDRINDLILDIKREYLLPKK